MAASYEDLSEKVANLVNAIKDQNEQSVRDILTNSKIDINESHRHPYKYGFLIENHYFIGKYIAVHYLTKIFEIFIEFGLDLNDIKIMSTYFTGAILERKYDFVRYLTTKLNRSQLINVLYGIFNDEEDPEYKYYMSPLFHVFDMEDLEMLHIFVLLDINMNHSIPVGYNNRLFPLCIAINYNKVELVKYLLHLPNITIRIPFCNVGSGLVMQGQSSTLLAKTKDNPEIIEMLDAAHLNLNVSELTLERRIYVSIIINEIDTENIPKYINNAMYEWLKNTQNPSPLVQRARYKIHEYLSRKRQREEFTE